MLFRRPTFLAATFVVAALLDPGGPVAQAQYEPIWSIGDQSIHFGTVDEPGLTVNDLPEPNDAEVPLVAQYQGAIAQRSQYAHYDQNGDLLFFIVDGNIYNGNGYLIADRALDAEDRNCRDCFYPGQEVHVYPVPGSCTRFFVFSLFSVEESGGVIEPPGLAASSSYSMIRLGVLDLSIANASPAFDNTDCIVRGGFMDQTDQGGANFYMLSNMQSTPDYITSNWDEGNDPRNALVEASMHGSSANGMLRAATIQLAGDQRGLAVVRTPQNLITLLIEGSGVRRLDTEGGASSYPMEWLDFPTELPPLNSIADGDQTFRGEMALRQVGNELRVAYSAYFIWPDINDGPLHQPRVAYWSFQLFEPTDENPTSLGFTMVPLDQPGANPKTYTPDSYPINTTTPPLDFAGNPVDRPTIGGLEFSPNGRYLYFTKSAQGTDEFPTTNFGYIDLTVPCGIGQPCLAWTFLDIGGPLEARKLADTQLGINIGPNGITPALYMLGADAVGDYWLASFTDPDFPASGSWTQQTVELSDIAFRTAADGTTQYRLLNKRVSASRHYETIQQEVCCEELVRMKDQSRTTDLGHQVWLPGDNPLCNATTPIYIATELRIPAGSSIIANDLEFRFAEGATMIVERGGRFVSNGCTFTSACDKRWAGIRVEGKRNNPVQTQTGAIVNERQGWFYLINSLVENAETGVRCSGPLVNGVSDIAYTGGVVGASSTTFRNCIVGALIERYQRSNGAAILPNLSYFSNCAFETTTEWFDFGVSLPRAHVSLFDVQGIRFSQCKFRNDASSSFTELERGWGIFAMYAGFDVEGTTVEDASLFQGLSAGVNAASGPFRKINIRRSWFRDNIVGANLQACFVPEVSRSHFFVPQGSSTEVPPSGLILHQSTGYVVEENSFEGGGLANMNVGLLIKGDVRAENRIYNNTFADLAAGTYTVDRQKGNTQQTEFLGLQLLCSDYTDCGYEYLLGDNTYIKSAQGFYISDSPEDSQLAANRFFNGGISGISISEVQPSGANAPFFNYLRHNVPECDPQDNNNPYFNDIRIDEANNFMKSADCGKGLLPVIGGGGGIAGFQLAAAQLRSAQTHFTETVDIGDRATLLDAIRQTAPLLPSHTLRDHLVGNSPLSDEVLLATIYREVPLDDWHLTQVMLANAKLNERVLNALLRSELLNAYMLAIVSNAGNGPTVKDLLQEEVELRSAEKAEALVRAVDELANDSTLSEPADVLYDLLATAPDHTDYYVLASMALVQGGTSLALSWLDSLSSADDGGHMILQEIATMQSTLGNDWNLADATQRTRLLQLAEKSEPGAAMAWAICYQLGETVLLPMTALPAKVKRLDYAHHQRKVETGTPFLQTHPNPTTGACMVVIGTVLDEAAQLHVTDPSGRTVRTLPLPTGSVLLELDLGGLANGLYIVELMLGDMKLGATKVTLQR